MIRWSDGLYGGLIAGAACACFYALVALVTHDGATPGAFFADVARALPPLRHAGESAPLAGLGVVLHEGASAAFGILYAALAQRVRSTRQAPGSVAWGTCYGLMVWWVLNEYLVPLLGIDVTQPLWEGLAGTVLVYGVVLSEYTTIAHRRSAARDGLVPATLALDPRAGG